MPASIRPDRFEAIVFDFDGTLAELRLDFAAMKKGLADLARDYIDPDSLPVLPVLEYVELLCEVIEGLNGGSVQIFRERAFGFIFEMELEAARRGILFSYTRPILEELQKRNVKVAIITRNCERAVRMVFPDMDRYCTRFLARDHVPRVKPHPDHLLRAIRDLGTDPGMALMVGDHPIDMETGLKAGVLTAGVCSGNATRADLVQSGAHWTADTCLDLMDILKDQNLI